MMRLALVVGCCAALWAAAPALALERKAADAIALRTLQPQRHGYPLYGLPAPLAAGQTVTEDGPGAKPVTLRKPAWFYWEDLEHGAGFEHPSRVLLLDAESGAVVHAGDMFWEPQIDGKPPPFLRSVEAEADRRYVVYSVPFALSPVVPSGTSPASAPSRLPPGS